MGERRDLENPNDQAEVLQPGREGEQSTGAEQTSEEDAATALPLDVLLRMGEEEKASGEEEGGGDFASLLASLHDHETEGASVTEEEGEDQELSRMISLMTSHDPGAGDDGEASADRESQEEDALLDALPEGTEMVFDLAPDDSGPSEGDPSEDAPVLSEGDAETEIASVIGDDSLESETGGEDSDPGHHQTTDLQAALPPPEEEALEADAIEDYDVTDVADALLATIGLDQDPEIPPVVPREGTEDTVEYGAPAETLVDDRILDDLRQLHADLESSAAPVAALHASHLASGLAEARSRILCIDDDPDNRSLFRGILDSEDYLFTDAESGEGALEALRDGEVDLILLNLDIASQDGFELIEEAASDVALSQVPILVNSASADHVEKALRLGASDYFIRPMSVIDVKFQIPIKARNLLKIRKAERMLALVGEPHDGDTVSVSALEHEPDTDVENGDLSRASAAAGVPEAPQTAPPPPPTEADALDRLLSGGGEKADVDDLLASADLPGESLDDLFEEVEEKDEEKDEDQGQNDDDLAALLKDGDETSEDALEDLLSEGNEKAAAEDAPSDGPGGTEALKADQNGEESLENLFGEDEEKDEDQDRNDDDLTALLEETRTDDDNALEDSLEDLFAEGQEEAKDARSDDLDAPLDHSPSEEELDSSSEDEEENEDEDKNQETAAGLAAAEMAAGAASLWPDRREESPGVSAAEVIGKPLQKGPALTWRSPSLARGARDRTIQERGPGKSRSGWRRPFYAVCALALVGVGVWALWAKQRLHETGEISSIVPTSITPKAPEVPEEKFEESSPVESTPGPRPRLEVKPEGSGGYEQARKQASVPTPEDQRLMEARVHIRSAVDEIASAGGQWWAPWRVLKTSGESIRELVNDRHREDILEVFGVNEARVEQNLKRKSIVDFLSRRGFKIKGKQASDLSAREVFEVLSMREIKTRDKVVAILTALKEKAEAARAQRAARMKAASPRLALRTDPPEFAIPPARDAATWEQPASVGPESRTEGPDSGAGHRARDA